MTLDELQKLCDEATPGPWTTLKYDSIDGWGNRRWIMAKDKLGQDWQIASATPDENLEFIAAARKYMPLLIEVAKAGEEMQAVYEKLKFLNDQRQLNAHQIFKQLQDEYDAHGAMFIHLAKLRDA